MTPKERITDRLRKTEVLQGVLPTPSVRSEELSTMVRQLRGWRGRCCPQRDGRPQTGAPDLASESAIRLFAGSPPLRQQIAGFAGAGISLFHASRAWSSCRWRHAQQAPTHGLSRPGFQQRILLETPRSSFASSRNTAPNARLSLQIPCREPALTCRHTVIGNRQCEGVSQHALREPTLYSPISSSISPTLYATIQSSPAMHHKRSSGSAWLADRIRRRDYNGFTSRCHLHSSAHRRFVHAHHVMLISCPTAALPDHAPRVQ